jgi:transcriptional regulator with XRE-family HTH domain
MDKSDEKAIIERIILLRRQYAGERGKSEFARSLNISPSTYNYYENNRIPPVDILLKICQITGADLHWLLTGDQNSPIKKGGPAQQNISDPLLQKIQKLLSDNPAMAQPVSAFVDLLDQKKGFENKIGQSMPKLDQARPGWIPVLGRTAAGIVHFWNEELLPTPAVAVTELDQLVKKFVGKDIVSLAEGKATVDLHVKHLVDGLKKAPVSLVQISGQPADQVVEFVQCEQIHKIYNDSFALRIDGDSMSPQINDGDIVILSPSVPASQGQIGVVRIANQIGVTCKLVRMTDQAVHLIPINEKYETKVVLKKDLLWALAVLCHISF